MRLLRLGWYSALFVVTAATSASANPQAASPRAGKDIYETICTTCHGPDGKGGVNLELEKTVTPPDFSDCRFARREADSDWLAVAHNGGPARGFSPLMPPWGVAYSTDELAGVVAHLRTFCQDDRWPRGELNLPRPLVTAKAFPEDEAVVGVTSRSGHVVTTLIYERRFGALNQFEVVVPIASHDAAGDRTTGLGDVALEYKRTVAHSLARGHIVSVTGELKLPTGRESRGLGDGVVVFEPFVTVGQLLPRESFLQAQAGFAFPASGDHDNEVFWRVAAGRTFEQGRFGRSWSPMLELVAARPLASGHSVDWDVVPQMQVTLNARQHVRVSGGVRMPVTDRDRRSSAVMVYLLWDWFDGGFRDGW